jgi:hypothetical protein
MRRCLKPDQPGDFDINWAKPQVLKRNKAWREYVEGEGDQLAEKAIEEVGFFSFQPLC